MAYARIATLRDEGVTEAQASDERLARLLDEATAFIDHATGWFFAPKTLTLHLGGRGQRTILLPYPPIALDAVVDGGKSVPLEDLVIEGSPVRSPFVGPSVTKRYGVFSGGVGGVLLRGRWGYTEEDGTSEGRTPLAIERAAIALVIRWLPRATQLDEQRQTRMQWRIVEERTRDQSYKLAPMSAAAAVPATCSGDPEVDEILRRYRRPPMLGAA